MDLPKIIAESMFLVVMSSPEVYETRFVSGPQLLEVWGEATFGKLDNANADERHDFERILADPDHWCQVNDEPAYLEWVVGEEGSIMFYRLTSATAGVALIAAERARQVSVEGWTPAHDDQHAGAEMALAASCYVMHAGIQACGREIPRHLRPKRWPWQLRWWKPSEDPVRNLEKAGALIAAEIDRLKRAKAAPAS